MDSLRFEQACRDVVGAPWERNGIGTLSEKTLHAVLKRCYEPHEENHETRIGGFVADIVGENGIIEIQTRGFDRLRKKLAAFLPVCPVTVVYPVAQVKRLSWVDPETGEVSSSRKSPKTGTPYEIFFELYRIKPFLHDPNLRFCIVLLELWETRWLNGWGKGGKRGSSRCDRIPKAFLGEVEIASPADYAKLVPESLPPRFTSKDYQKRSGLSLSGAQTALNVLFSVGAVERAGKQGGAYLYEKTGPDESLPL